MFQTNKNKSPLSSESTSDRTLGYTLSTILTPEDLNKISGGMFKGKPTNQPILKGTRLPNGAEDSIPIGVSHD